ncbi:restriction endonuclease subunit S [Jeotgalicoccus sp. WY2]|uniref:restriction endonuclease subunit S n=1 Tax=Jeotgalicoccus sp. WY2 TaxID=2708346 RepID=UPI002021D3E9|nr:restriction endonuclease subunit S [Jeotgalicoccus sp. WY2]
MGKTPPRKLRDLFSDYEGEKWVSISDMKEDGPYLFDTKEYLNPKAVKEYRVKVAPENSILLSFKLTIGRVKIAHTDLTTNEAIAHFIQTDKSPPYEYTYLYLKYFNYNELGNTSSIATAVNSKIIKAMPILVPDIKTLTKFQEIVSPLFNSIRSYQLQNKNLIELRDTLLPKLMSGEIELPDDLEVDEHAKLLQ